jgi:hypothetical protein
LQPLQDEVPEPKKEISVKIDHATVNKLFEELKNTLGQIEDSVARAKRSRCGMANLDELNGLESRLVCSDVWDEAAVGWRGMTCLSCGRPNLDVTESIEDEEMAAQLNEATVCHLTIDDRSCFVDGPEAELYY